MQFFRCRTPDQVGVSDGRVGGEPDLATGVRLQDPIHDAIDQTRQDPRQRQQHQQQNGNLYPVRLAGDPGLDRVYGIRNSSPAHLHQPATAAR